jgi:hypothetical protein
MFYVITKIKEFQYEQSTNYRNKNTTVYRTRNLAHSVCQIELVAYQTDTSKYLLYLPTEEELIAEIERQKMLLKL